ncbi:hypothetical protein AAFP35_24235 [Gordonia sp. CPCC 206044]|uniref:hypothetical protein n=1 Tax=Gordonia sp. CPCC 206044 TaxID=3140793 RepID=UPI003AF34C2C
MFPAHDYPWTSPHRRQQTDLHPDRLDGRRLVVAVGSNASPAVLRAKLSGDPAAMPPLMAVAISGLAVGYSAHVSRRGYVPAAPYRAPGARLSTVGAWLNDRETTALDRTEPNYDRMVLSTAHHPVAAAVAPETFSLYVSRHGVLADPRTATPVPFGTQQEIIDWLETHLRDPGLSGTATAVCARLADRDVGRRVTEAIRTTRLSTDSRITTTKHDREGLTQQ